MLLSPMIKKHSLLERMKRFNLSKILRRHSIPDDRWHGVTRELPLLNRYTPVEKAQLRVLSTLFLQRKSFTGAHGLEITPEMQLIVAAQACVQILELGISSFDGWHSIIIYPDAFVVERQVSDDYGLVHDESRALGGEAWMQGPVLLSWDDVERDSFRLNRGHHIIIHEFAHKLDMLNGRANGMPPLHPDMAIEDWTRSLSRAYQHLRSDVAHHKGDINAYAATDPAEFFAVVCEYFFTAPDILYEHYPDVYQQLRAYFRQDIFQRSGLTAR